MGIRIKKNAPIRILRRLMSNFPASLGVNSKLFRIKLSILPDRISVAITRLIISMTMKAISIAILLFYQADYQGDYSGQQEYRLGKHKERVGAHGERYEC